MARFYMEGNDEWKRQQMLKQQRGGYFPNANPGAGAAQPLFAPGVAEGMARMAEIARTSTYKSRRAAGQTVYSPEKGSMFVPSGQVQDYVGKGYTTTAPPSDLQQAYNQGYGAPNPPAPQVVGGAGGNYLAQGGVMNPVENLPVTSPYSTFGSNLQKSFAGKALSGIGTFAANLFNRPATSGSQYASYMPDYNTTGYTPPSFTGGNYRRSGPNRYFDY